MEGWKNQAPSGCESAGLSLYPGFPSSRTTLTSRVNTDIVPRMPPPTVNQGSVPSHRSSRYPPSVKSAIPPASCIPRPRYGPASRNELRQSRDGDSPSEPDWLNGFTEIHGCTGPLFAVTIRRLCCFRRGGYFSDHFTVPLQHTPFFNDQPRGEYVSFDAPGASDQQPFHDVNLTVHPACNVGARSAELALYDPLLGNDDFTRNTNPANDSAADAKITTRFDGPLQDCPLPYHVDLIRGYSGLPDRTLLGPISGLAGKKCHLNLSVNVLKSQCLIGTKRRDDKKPQPNY